MASSGEEVRVPIGIPVETNAAAAADDVEGLRDQIARSKDVIKDASNHLRNLRGSSDLVKAAKDQLRAAVDREKQAISSATLKLVKQGTTLDKLAAQTKTAAKGQDDLKKKASGAVTSKDSDRAKAFGDALSRVGGPAAGLRDRMKELREFASQAAGSGGMGLLSLGIAGVTAAAVAALAAVGALGIALARWAVRGADAARSMQLVREAATTSTISATNLGTQIDVLAKKVPTSTAELNKLGASLARSRLGGQQTVDLLNAIGQANAALGDESLGNKMKELVERGRMAQRMYLGLYELQGTGLDFEDVAQALAGSMKVGVDKARQALLEGRVSLSDGAAALRSAVEKKFGGINLRKMMSLEGLSDTFGKMLASLTKDVNLEPAAQAVFKLIHAFDDTTATGAVLKRMVTVFGNGIVSVVEKGAPIVQSFLRGMVVGGLQIYIAYLQVRNALKKAFGDSDILKNVDTLGIAMKAGRMALIGIVAGVTLLGAALAVPIAAVGLVVAGFMKLQDMSENLGRTIRETFTDVDWSATGLAIVDGLVGGIGSGAKKLVDSVKGLGETAKKAFRDALGIRSPSKVFERFGKNGIDAGVVKGVNKGAPEVKRAVENMAPPPPMPEPGGLARGARAATAGAAPTIQATFQIMLQGGAGAPPPSEQVQDPGLMAALTKVLKEAAAGAGMTAVVDA